MRRANAGEAGEPKLILVGLPDAAVKESDDRVFSALSNSGFRPPRTRTTINLAPAHLRKEGPFYDLPIALGILAPTQQLQADNLGDWLIAGELSLSGATRPVRGAIAMARLARTLGKHGLLLPAISAEEAALVEGVNVYRVDSLDAAVRFLTGERLLQPLEAAKFPLRSPTSGADGAADFCEIKGQHALRRAVEVAVAGNHNLPVICYISPGTEMRAITPMRRLLLGTMTGKRNHLAWYIIFPPNDIGSSKGKLRRWERLSCILDCLLPRCRQTVEYWRGLHAMLLQHLCHGQRTLTR